MHFPFFSFLFIVAKEKLEWQNTYGKNIADSKNVPMSHAIRGKVPWLDPLPAGHVGTIESYSLNRRLHGQRLKYKSDRPRKCRQQSAKSRQHKHVSHAADLHWPFDIRSSNHSPINAICSCEGGTWEKSRAKKLSINRSIEFLAGRRKNTRENWGWHGKELRGKSGATFLSCDEVRTEIVLIIMICASTHGYSG